MATQINGDSPQAVALSLLEQIALAENWENTTQTMPSNHQSQPWHKTRAEILDAYKECLQAVL